MPNGNHYARSMSSWALLFALTGAEIDAADGGTNSSPVPERLSNDEPFKTFWSNEQAWSNYSQTWNADEQVWRSSLDVLGGE